MRIKTILVFFLALCSSIVVAQSVSDITHSYNVTHYRYWFDQDEKANVGTYRSGALTLDVSALEEGFHTLHYQVQTAGGDLSPASSYPFFRLAPSTEQLNKDYAVKTLRYWFDQDVDVHQAAYQSGTATLDVSALEEGFHTLHYQVQTAEGDLSPASSYPFFRLAPSTEQLNKEYAVKTLRYWFDQDVDVHQTAYHSGAATLDVSALEEGFHTLHYQVQTAEGDLSPACSYPFFRLATTTEQLDKDYAVKTVRYWFDQDVDVHQAAYQSGTATLDVSALEEGFHTLHYQVQTADGELSPANSHSFFRIAPNTEQLDKDYAVKTVRYWFDNDKSTTVTGDYAGGILQLDLSHLAEGQHTMCYQVVTDDGALSPATSVSFYRSLYDVYIRSNFRYSQSAISGDAVLSSKPDLKLHYEVAQPDVRGHLTVDADATLSLGKFVQTGNLGSNNTSNKYLREGDEYYHITTLVNNGFMRADNVFVNERFYRDRWHFISLPFNANISDITVPDGTFWAIRTYDGEQRAAGNMNAVWTNLHGGDQMKAGQGYILQLTSEKSDKAVELSFASVNDADKNRIFTAKDVSVPLVEHEAEFAHNRGWNFIGNPYPSFYDTRNMDLSGTIIVWNSNGYSAYSLRDDSYVLMPFEAFFIQKPLDADAVTFSAAGRQHTHEATVQAAKQNVLRSKPSERRLFNFTLSHDGMVDHARIVFNPHALLSYESDKDAAKFMENTPTAPQLYSIEGGVKFAINERPESDGIMTFSMYAPVDGEYVLHVDATEADMSLLDTETGEITALGNSDYIFYTDAGSYDARFVIAMGDAHITSVSQIAAGDEGEIQVADQCLKFKYLRDKDVCVYGADGQVYYQARTASGQVRLGKGVYVISVDGQTTKVAVK